MIESKESIRLFDKMMQGSKSVDFDNVWDTMGFATLIFAVANEIGVTMSNSSRQSYEAVQTIKLAKEWIHNVNSQINSMTAGDAMDILEPYDLVHRLAQRSPMSREFADDHIFKAFESRIYGDKSVNEYYLFRIIKAEIIKKNKLYFNKPLDWYSICIDRWYKKFSSGSAFESISDYDTLEILSILMSEDLFVFTGRDQDKLKKKLYENYNHLFDKIQDYGFMELSALSHFLSGSREFITAEKYMDIFNAITLAQIANPETNRFYRLTLQRNLNILNESRSLRG